MLFDYCRIPDFVGAYSYRPPVESPRVAHHTSLVLRSQQEMYSLLCTLVVA